MKGGGLFPAVETAGYKMVDVATATPGGFAFPEKRRFCFGLRAWWGWVVDLFLALRFAV